MVYRMMKLWISSTAVILLMLSLAFVVNAQSTQTLKTPPLEASNPKSDKFRILICDGPARLNNIKPDGTIDPLYVRDPKFIACDFNGVMLQIQHIINILLVTGVLGAIVGFAWAGGLHITGIPENIKKARKMFPRIFWGFVIMLTAWFIVYQILSWLTEDKSGFKTLLGS